MSAIHQPASVSIIGAGPCGIAAAAVMSARNDWSNKNRMALPRSCFCYRAQLQGKIAAFHSAGKVIGAICHGTLVLARTRDQEIGESLLHGRTVTTLIQPVEKFVFMRTFYRAGRRYRTYWKYTEDEVREGRRPARPRRTRRFVGTTTGRHRRLIVTARHPADVTQYSERFLQLAEIRSAKHIS